MVVDEGSLFGENPLSAFLVGPYMPYSSASQSLLSHLDDVSFRLLITLLDASYDVVSVLAGNPGDAFM